MFSGVERRKNTHSALIEFQIWVIRDCKKLNG